MIQEYIEDRISELIIALTQLNIPISDFSVENCINDVVLEDNPDMNIKKATKIAVKIIEGINQMNDIHPIIRSMGIKVHDSWLTFFNDNIDTINHKINQIGNDVYFPPADDVWNTFTMDIKDIKVMILAQDPYYTKGIAHGYALSCKYPNPPQPSLKTIYKELERSYNDFKSPKYGDLTSWHEQGVFLLNRFLTVQEDKPRSHTFWGTFTTNLISYISSIKDNMVFMLWGNDAKALKDKIDDKKHCILTAGHPSLVNTYGTFIGCNHFIMANEYLISKGIKPVNWHSICGVPAHIVLEKLNNIK